MFSGKNRITSRRRSNKVSSSAADRRRRLLNSVVAEVLEPRLMLTGFHVNQVMPVGTTDPFDSIQIQFNQAVDNSTVVLSDFTMAGSGGPISPQSVSRISSTV